MNVLLILVFVGSIAVLGASTPSQAPRFVEEPSSVIARKNSLVVFNCSTTATPKAKIEWLKDGVRLQEDGRRVIQPSGTLHIQAVRGRRRGLGGDDGVFQCVASNSAGTIASRRASLNIAVISKKFKKHPQSVTASEGTTAQFTCKIKRALPPATISWERDGQPLMPSSKHITHSNGTLQIVNVQKSDEDEYRCVATNIANTRRSNYARLTVKKVPNPYPPRNVTGVSQSSSEVVISWLPPVGLTVLGYSVNHQPADRRAGIELQKVVPASQTSTLIRNLMEFTNYTFYVKPYYKKHGAGMNSNTITVQTLSAKPSSPPKKVTLQSLTPDSIDVKWDLPLKKDRNGIVTSFIIKYSRKSGNPANPQTIELPSSIQQKTISGLQSGVAYSVQIAAATKVGWGPFSAEVVQTVTTQQGDWIGSPRTTVSPLNSTALQVSWQAPSYGAKRVREYRLFCERADSKGDIQGPHHISKKATNYQITNLSPNTKYIVRLMAWDGKKTGQPAVEVGTTLLGGSAPQTNGVMQVECTAGSPTSISVRISWQTSSNSRNAGYYTITYGIVGNLNKEKEMTKHVLTKITHINNLRPGRKYHVNVKAFDANRSAITGWVHTMSPCQTSELAPETPPRNFKFEIMTSTSVDLHWEPPDKPNGKISHYLIAYTTDPKLTDDKWVKKKEVLTKFISRFEKVVTARLQGLTPNVTFYIKVKAGNQEGYGPWTDAIKVLMVVPDKQKQDDAPVLSQRHVSVNSVEVSWPTPMSYKGKASSYLVLYTTEQEESEMNWQKRVFMVGGQQPFGQPSDQVVVQLSALTPNKTYYVKVRADYGTQYGPWSKVIKISMHIKDNPASGYNSGPGNMTGSQLSTGEPKPHNSEMREDFEVKLGIIIGCIISAFCVVMLVLFIIWRCPCRLNGAKKQDPVPQANGKPQANGYIVPPHSSHQTVSSASTGHSTGSTYEEGSAGSSISNSCQCRCTCSASRWPPVTNMPKKPQNQVAGNGHIITGNGQLVMTQSLQEFRKSSLQNYSKEIVSNGVSNGHLPGDGSVPLEVLSDGQNGEITVPRRSLKSNSISVDV